MSTCTYTHKVHQSYLHDKIGEHGGAGSADKTVLQQHQQSTGKKTITFNLQPSITVSLQCQPNVHSTVHKTKFPVEDLQPSGATLLTSGCWSGQISLALEPRAGWRSEWAAVRPRCPPLWSPTSAWSDRASGPSGRPWRPPAPDSPSRTAGNGHTVTQHAKERWLLFALQTLHAF